MSRIWDFCERIFRARHYSKLCGILRQVNVRCLSGIGSFRLQLPRVPNPLLSRGIVPGRLRGYRRFLGENVRIGEIVGFFVAFLASRSIGSQLRASEISIMSSESRVSAGRIFDRCRLRWSLAMRPGNQLQTRGDSTRHDGGRARTQLGCRVRLTGKKNLSREDVKRRCLPAVRPNR